MACSAGSLSSSTPQASSASLSTLAGSLSSSAPQASSASLSTLAAQTKKKRGVMHGSSSLRMPPADADSASNKRETVFSDAAQGIICYRMAETGEIICEGLDEGPHFDPGSSLSTHRARQDMSLPPSTQSQPQPRIHWDNTLQIFVFEGYDEG
ncbi:hypothetical protein GOP47_0004093 [Adiantum capillus-veneris]|uniref:Uncharacterized protein n=1 Tax=Adiantum capillus-veneris TaxID=13818 RepID=A0A9D4V6V6_ADICA|nr:hypothetical protein GOP47_0004093 [Adiantum capillus-veneris]